MNVLPKLGGAPSHATVQRPPLTFGNFQTTPENRAAILAAQEVAACVCSRRARRTINPLFLHAPPGTGKTHLATALLEEVTRRCPDLIVGLLPASDYPLEEPEAPARTESDLLVIEDLQHLPQRAAETLVQMLDGMRTRQQQLVFTAS